MESNYATERAACSAAREAEQRPAEQLLITDAALVALVALYRNGATLAQLAAALNTMDSRGLRRQLGRLSRPTKRRGALVGEVGSRWYVREAL